MRSGRSSSDRAAPESRARSLRVPPAAVFALAAALLPAGIGSAQVLPPPPENPEATPTSAPKAHGARAAACPRCGYRCDPGWHYCVACGWDLTTLVGEAEESRLQAIARATVRVTVSGRPNRHATAFPFGGSGLLLTSARLLIGADETSVNLMTFNNREYPASIVGYDLSSGVGLLKAGIPGAQPIEVAPASPSPPQGSWAVCYPIRFEDDVVRYLPVSLHRGHLTATGQTGTFLVSLENLLRTDHAIEVGCTGGPLIDSRGPLAGMILGGPDDGITYALPLEGLQSIIDSLVRKEKPVRPFFGMGLVMADERRRLRFEIDSQPAHPLIAYLIPGSPAAQMDVRPGEVLLAVGGVQVATVWEAGTRLLAAAPGGPGVALTLARRGVERQVKVVPVKRPERILLDPIDELQETLEVSLKEVTSGPGAQQGLVISHLVRGGRGEEGRYKNGDLIVAVDGKSVKSFEAFGDFIQTKFKGIFAEAAPGDRKYASSYVVTLEVRTEKQEKVTRRYVNLFPDYLAPPVY